MMQPKAVCSMWCLGTVTASCAGSHPVEATADRSTELSTADQTLGDYDQTKIRSIPPA
jgi:hypothetical protein